MPCLVLQELQNWRLSKGIWYELIANGFICKHKYHSHTLKNAFVITI